MSNRQKGLRTDKPPAQKSAGGLRHYDAKRNSCHGGKNSDTELVALAAEFERLQREIDPLLAHFFSLPPGHPELEAVGMAETASVLLQDEIVARARGISPEGVAGLCAKATISRGLYLRQRSDEIEQDCLNEEESFAWELINNVLQLQRRAGA
jgi:hypothetical protein